MIYLDHASTTPLDPVVLEAMRPYLTEHYGNPSSTHTLGREARVAVEDARAIVAGVLNSEPSEVIFTSGGTEADNLAILGTLRALEKEGTVDPVLVTSQAEHKAVLEPAERWEKIGRSVRFLSPDSDGCITPHQISSDSGTGLVSIMLANNETGAISPVKELADQARASGAVMHTDAVQAAGHLSLDVEALGVDLMSLSGHKIGGPKGVGVLYVRGGTPFSSLLVGGSQEIGRRGGTENVAAIVGFAKALQLADSCRDEESLRLRRLRDRLWDRVQEELGDRVCLNTPLGNAAPHILNLSFPPANGKPFDGEMLILSLDVAGVMVSAGSACTSGAVEPSHVLQAMGVPRETAAATVRFSLGQTTTEEDVDAAAEVLVETVNRMAGTSQVKTPGP